jgi:hypothetical protein
VIAAGDERCLAGRTSRFSVIAGLNIKPGNDATDEAGLE